MNYGKEWRLGLLAGIAVGVVVGWVASTWPGLVIATSAKHWWDIATAVATGAAVFVALMIASLDSRRLKRENRERASLYAASLVVPLREYVEALENTAVAVIFADAHALDDRFNGLLGDLNRIRLKISPEILAHVVPLGSAAHTIMWCEAQVAAIRIEMTRHQKSANSSELVPSNNLSAEFAMRVTTITQDLKFCIATLNNSATAYTSSREGLL